MHQIVIYTKDWCGYCKAATQLLNQLGLEFQEIDVTSDLAEYKQMVQRAEGRTSVPQIFVGETPIGGFTDLYQMVKENKFPPVVQ